MMRNILLVALGGALGSVCRYLVSSSKFFSFTLQRLLESAFFDERGSMAGYPWATFVVNILGSLLIGLLAGLAGKGILSPEMKLLLVTGFCGGFTTFSTFANESFGMMKAGDVLLMAVYIGASVVVGIFAVWCGSRL